jgi:DNA-binding MarR family transcriptional regulator
MQDIHEADSLDTDVARLRELVMAIGRRRPLRDPIAAALEELDLTPPQLHALLWLGNDGPLTMGELARRVGITEKTITGVVDRLERAGLAERTRDDADRRVVRARLTRKGAATHRKLDAQMLERMRRILGRLEAADRRDLFRILNNLMTSLATTLPKEETTP